MAISLGQEETRNLIHEACMSTVRALNDSGVQIEPSGAVEAALIFYLQVHKAAGWEENPVDVAIEYIEGCLSDDDGTS